MNSRIFTGFVSHERLEPVGHRFQYPVYFYAFDLDELDELGRRIPWFGHNRFRPVSLWDKDYLDRREGTIRSKLFRFLSEKGLAEGVERIELVTSARYFNYVFNPVSFYYCYREGGGLQAVVTEVNNTFGERHLYILGGSGAPRPGFEARHQVSKNFHVSPFNDMRGDYEFHFSGIEQDLDIRINILKEGREVFHSRLWGKSMPMTSSNLLGTLVRYPISAALTLPRILWQAGKLYRKGLKVYAKPHPQNEMTIRVKAPTLFQKAALKLVSRWLSRMKTGCLTLILPDQSLKLFGDPQAPDSQRITLKVKAWDFFTKVLKGGDLAFGEAFIAGDWETSNLAETLKLFTANWESVVEAHPWTTRWGGFFDRLFHWSRKNSPSGSRRNIRSHYDLSNAFFQTFLDDSLTYSSAVYENPGQSLEQAQRHKIRMLLEKARLKPADHLLEIGSGWGTLAMEAARQTGCRVTTITISEEQFQLASRRVREAGLQDRVEVQLRDYRRLTGRYDRILSVEMLEAVGHEHYGTYFAACDRLLKPGGLAVIQVITMPDQRYEGYRKRCDFIQKHIFPGAVIPSLKALNDAMTRHSQLMIEDMENIGPHYARTLADWTQRFREQKEAIEKLGFDGAFQRKWLYYFAYCEAGFDLRVLNNLQLVLTRPGNPNLPTVGGAVNHPARQDRAEKQNVKRL